MKKLFAFIFSTELSVTLCFFLFIQTDFGLLNSAMDYGCFRLDHDYMPFGRLSNETIEKAREVLREIK